MADFKYIPLIGLEVHVELKTNSKMFCGCTASYFGKQPNSCCCPVCLGFPGALPVPNRKAVEWCLLTGLALGCKVNSESYFERKNYFYPDLPKGYQISQYAKPLTYGGKMEIGNVQTANGKPVNKTIRINRVHMEEDTGKLTHACIDGQECSLIDFNRSGVPLVEIVTEPDFTDVEEVVFFLKKLQKIIRYLGVSDADMEKGSMRLEPTINLRVNREEKEFHTPLVEIKNINSFRFVKQALEYEIQRQFDEFNKTGEEKNIGNKTTVGFDEEKKRTFLQRSKEEANDYRYFPEPDIPPMRFMPDQILKLKEQIPELPDQKEKRLIGQYQLDSYGSTILCEEKRLADYFEECVCLVKNQKISLMPKQIANYLINKKIDIKKTSPASVLKAIMSQNQFVQITDRDLEKIIKEVLIDNSEAVADYKGGKKSAIMFLLGMVLREAKIKLDPQLVMIKIKKLIK